MLCCTVLCCAVLRWDGAEMCTRGTVPTPHARALLCARPVCTLGGDITSLHIASQLHEAAGRGSDRGTLDLQRESRALKGGMGSDGGGRVGAV